MVWMKVAVLAGHGGRVRSVAWAPDGRRIVSAGDDGAARVWISSAADEWRAAVVLYAVGDDGLAVTGAGHHRGRETAENPLRVHVPRGGARLYVPLAWFAAVLERPDLVAATLAGDGLADVALVVLAGRGRPADG